VINSTFFGEGTPSGFSLLIFSLKSINPLLRDRERIIIEGRLFEGRMGHAG